MSVNDDIAFLFGLHGVDLRGGTSKEAPSEEKSSGMHDEAVSSGCKDAGGELAAFLERHRVETAAPRGDGIASTHPVGSPPARRAETAAQQDDKGCEALKQHSREDMHAGDLPWYERLGLVPARPQKASRKTSRATRVLQCTPSSAFSVFGDLSVGDKLRPIKGTLSDRRHI